MRALLWGTTVATLTTLMGCANGLNASGALERRGSVQVASQARLLVIGPVSHVHTSVNGGKRVSLFVVDAVNGDDRDCVIAATRTAVMAPAVEARRQVRVPQGSELCVAMTTSPSQSGATTSSSESSPASAAASTASSSSTEVLWHAHMEPNRRTLVLQ